MSKASWIADDDEGYPSPARLTYTVTLHECQSCERKAANPPTGGWSCPCGGDVVSQDYTPTQYAELRKYGEVRTTDV